jgi:hypothetical protein
MPDRKHYYAFRIELKGIKPVIWRTFYVPSDTTLYRFQYFISYVMGWNGYHFYYYTINGEEYEKPDLGDAELLNEEIEFSGKNNLGTRLDQLGLRKGSKIKYLYDYGDNWQHDLKVISMDYIPKEGEDGLTPDKPRVREYGCIDGARACPPEDIGGVGGYEEFLEALKNPGTEEYEFAMTVCDFNGFEDGFDPDYFCANEM